MMIDNLITIKGGSYSDIKKALKQWINLYEKDLQEDFVFKLFKHGRGSHAIQVDERLDNRLFYYLVNYLDYPEGIEYKIDIQGFTTGKENNILKDKQLLVYISSDDKQGDNVFVATSDNKNFKIDFGGRIMETRERKSFRQPTDLTFENFEVLKVNKLEYSKKIEKISEKNIGKRFRIISHIGLGLLSISFIICFFYIDEFLMYVPVFVLSFGFSGWFLFDYKMLQFGRYYVHCFLISAIIFGYGLFLHQKFNINIDIIIIALQPLTFLVIQKLIRAIYKVLLNKEPVFEPYGSAPTFWDNVYSLFLICAYWLSLFIIKGLLALWSL